MRISTRLDAATRLVVLPDAEAMVNHLAPQLAGWLAAAAAARGLASLVLAGGSTPQRLYRQLAVQAGMDGLPWPSVSVYFGDERAVPPDHGESNYRMARESLLERLPEAPAAVHRMPAEMPHEVAAPRYAELLPQRFDVVLLGMGEDGHTASLFPGRPEADDREQRVLAAQGPKPPPRRLSLGLAALNAADQVVCLVSGAGKAEALAEVLRQRAAGAPPDLPAARLAPHGGQLTYLVDSAAAALLDAAPGNMQS